MAQSASDVDKWHTLVHVCRRWRDVVFASPRRLNLRLLCRKRPVREMLDIWPALPIEIEDITWRYGKGGWITSLQHSSIPIVCVPSSSGSIPSSAWEALAEAMQVPFPELTHLVLWSDNESTSVLPDSFLGGSAPRLQTLWLSGISFPALPNLLLSASDLVTLSLLACPSFGVHFTPGDGRLLVLLEQAPNFLETSWDSNRLNLAPDQPSPPPWTRVVLPLSPTLPLRACPIIRKTSSPASIPPYSTNSQ
jgi:hypothetical protein